MTDLNFADIFIKKYPKSAEVILSIFEEANGNKATFDSISKSTLVAFVDTLMEKVAQSSARTYCAQLKSVINLYCDECGLTKGWEKILTVKNDVSEQIYLTDEEVKKVIQYQPVTYTEATVQQQFILSCLVGARHSDIIRLTEKNIRNGYVCYVSQKTHMKATVPISDISAKILTGHFSHAENEDMERLAYKKKRVCDTTYNNTLRHICELCGINEELTLYKRGQYITAPKWSFVSSHTGRRTCASLLYLHGCDIYSISRILAHASVETTAQSYILCPLRTLSEETMGYFSQFCI